MRKKPLLTHLNLNIAPGENRFGRTLRRGQSTIVNLLLRFYDLNEGQILIDGQNIREVTQNSLRQQIGMAVNDTSRCIARFATTSFTAKPDANDAQMMLAAQRAQAHDFILQLTDAKGRTG